MIRQKIYPIIALLVFVFSIWYVFYDLSPQYQTDYNAKAEEFSIDRAFEHVENIAKKPHYVGSDQHSYTRNYIIEQLEQLGLKVHTQSDYSLNAYGEFTIPQNIIARIKGENQDAKALLLMSHYDSDPHSSRGASDAASGVAAVLEAIRAYQAKQIKPKHDIIICFTDAEEVGLLGAKLFVDKHPWAKKVGLVLNFESRGSGGPSNMIVETNHGNAKMIRAFAESDVEHPVATSLMYSVYKMLPNDTDSTVFREKADIPSFFFAFIDDHYDYHTALDVPTRLDKKSLAHQGDYAFNLINYFSEVSLDDNLKSDAEKVYFNLPEFGLFYYPFSWIWFMYAACLLLFVGILYQSFKTQSISRREIFKGFIPFLVTLILAAALGYFGWQVVLWIYPEYSEILQGFPYNGHDYIFAFVCFTLSLSFLIYRRFQRNLNVHNAMVAPLFFWFVICAFINIYLPGAAYFTLALGFAIVAWAFSIFRQTPNLFINWILSLPAIGLIIPLIQFFPVGLGIGMLFISTLLSVLVFGLLYSFIGYLPFKRSLSIIFLLLGISFLIVAHVNSDFSKTRPKPNSLVYLQHADEQKAYWNTYDENLDSWNKDFFKKNLIAEETAFQSKYNTAFTKSAEAQFVNVPMSRYNIKVDTLGNNLAKVSMNISPESSIKRIELYADKNYDFKELNVNRQKADTLFYNDKSYHIFQKRYQSRLLTYHVVNQEDLNINFIGKLPLPTFEIYESRFDLLDNEELGVPKRSPQMMPKPFVVNDAIIIKREINFEK